jgi:hypothetical protein
MFCNYCGTQLPDVAIFCNKCGRPQSMASSIQSQDNSGPSVPPVSGEPMDTRRTSIENIQMVQAIPQVSGLPTAQTSSSTHDNSPAKVDIFHRPVRSASSQPTFKQTTGFIIAGIGGLLDLFSFFSLPAISLGIFGSLTGQQLATLGSRYSGPYSDQLNVFQFLWIDPVIAVAIVVIAGIQVLNCLSVKGKTPSDKTAFAVILLSILSPIILFIAASLQPNEPQYVGGFTSNSTTTVPTLSVSFGLGLWVYIVAIIVILIGGIVQVKSLW